MSRVCGRNFLNFVFNLAVVLNMFWFCTAIDWLSVDVIFQDACHCDHWPLYLPMGDSSGCIVGTEKRNGIFFVSSFAVRLNKFCFRAATGELSVDVLARDAFALLVCVGQPTHGLLFRWQHGCGEAQFH